jgi:hypothetical protein
MTRSKIDPQIAHTLTAAIPRLINKLDEPTLALTEPSSCPSVRVRHDYAESNR